MTRLFIAFLFCLPFAASHAADGTLAAIQKRGTIRLGYLQSAPPFSFAGSDGSPQGYSVELCKRVAENIRQGLKLADLKLQWVSLQLQERIEAVRSGKVDIECGTTTWTLSRQQQVDFSLMTFVDGATVLVSGKSDLLRIADLNGKKIAVVPTTTTADSLQRALNSRMLRAEVIQVSTAEEGIAKVKSGAVDGYASDRVVLISLGLASKSGSDFRVLDEDFSVEPYALALPRGDPDFRLEVNRALAGLYRSGEIEAVFDRWLGPLGRPSTLLTALYYLQGLPE